MPASSPGRNAVQQQRQSMYDDSPRALSAQAQVKQVLVPLNYVTCCMRFSVWVYHGCMLTVLQTLKYACTLRSLLFATTNVYLTLTLTTANVI